MKKIHLNKLAAEPKINLSFFFYDRSFFPSQIEKTVRDWYLAVFVRRKLNLIKPIFKPERLHVNKTTQRLLSLSLRNSLNFSNFSEARIFYLSALFAAVCTRCLYNDTVPPIRFSERERTRAGLFDIFGQFHSLPKWMHRPSAFPLNRTRSIFICYEQVNMIDRKRNLQVLCFFCSIREETNIIKRVMHSPWSVRVYSLETLFKSSQAEIVVLPREFFIFLYKNIIIKEI